MEHPQSDILFAVCGVVILFIYWHFKTKTRTLPLPPGPKPLPIIGNLLDLPKGKAWETFGLWGKRYGDVVYIRSLGQSYIILNTFKAVSDLFEKRSSIYSGRSYSTMVNLIMDLGRLTTMLPYGNIWKTHRTMFHQQLNPTALQQYQPRQVAAARELIRFMQEKPQNFELHIFHMVAGIVMSIAYGHDIAPKDDPFVELAEQVTTRFTHAIRPGQFLVDFIPALRYVPEWVPGAGFQKFGKESRKIWNDSLDLPFEEVKRHLAAGTALPSFVANTFAELDKSQNDWEEILKAVAGSMYSAGTDTTVSTIHLFILAMVLYPEVQKVAHAELDRVVGRERLPEFSDRIHLPYVEAVVKEVLRWHPAAPIGLPHTVSEDDNYTGYHIQKGAILIPNTWQVRSEILHDPKMYRNPFDFFPERFLSNEGDVRDPAAAGAFGYGRRICPGRHLAVSSIWIAVASLLAAFDITPAKDEHGRDINVSYALDPPPSLVIRPRPFPCTFKVRYTGMELDQARRLYTQFDLNSVVATTITHSTPGGTSIGWNGSIGILGLFGYMLLEQIGWKCK